MWSCSINSASFLLALQQFKVISPHPLTLSYLSNLIAIMVRVLGNLTPKILVQALNSTARLATSSLKMRRRGGTRGSDHSNGSGGGRGSGISDGSGGKHNKMVQKNGQANNSKNSE
ncbi:hypothetical protein E2542_SST26639 [Spatholobus suberectus]|nr:hypothetical protein E2542_SST26639 [Spatholobus suberectus]